MNSELRKVLAACIADMERGANVEDCLKRNPSRAAELRPHLEAWAAFGGASLVQPPRAAFNRGRREMLSALQTGTGGLSPLATARLAPAWATAVAAVAAVVIVLGGAAGASAALGGPDVAGDVFDAVGVTDGEGDGGGISHSSASERGLECANPNAFEGSGNSEDKAQNSDDAHEKESCSKSDCETDGAAEGADNAEDEAEVEEDDAEVEDDEAKGEDEDNDGVDDIADVNEGNVNGNGNANGNANGNGNGNGNGNANANGQSNGQPCAEDSEEETGGAGSTESDDGINNAPDAADNGKDHANDNAFEGSDNAEDRGDNRNDAGAPDGSEDPHSQGQGNDGD